MDSGFAMQHRCPHALVWAGVVGNVGACVLLAIAASMHVWNDWGMTARAMMWGSLLGVGAITLGLAWFGLLKKPAVR